VIFPRPYQVECIDFVLDRLSKGVTRQLVSMPTGTGKTVIFSLMAKQFQCHTLILAHRDELLSQAKLGMIWPETSVGIVEG
jgi:ATP-dependent helicase IRC3